MGPSERQASPPGLIERFFARRGLPAGIAECLCLDRTGFLWLGTDDGLRRFDGYDIKGFRPAAADPAGSRAGEVRCLLLARSGALWVGTLEGLDRFDPKTETFERLLAGVIVRALAEEDSGTLWVGTQSGLDAIRLTAGRSHSYRHDPHDPESLGLDDVRALLQDDEGRLWIGTAGGGLDCRDPQTGKFLHFRHDPADPASLSHNQVTSIHQDRAGRLWIGTHDGLNRFDPAADRFVRYPAGPGGVGHHRVTTICEDDGGGLWIGSDGGGLDRLDLDRGEVCHYRHDPEDRATLTSDRIVSCCRDGRGDLWIGTHGGGLDKVASASGDADLEDGTFEPAVVLTDFELVDRSLVPGEAIDGRVPLVHGVGYAEEIRLTHRDRLVRFHFAALDFADPEQNEYAYRMVGVDDDWQPADASRRFATYTNLRPGNYRFEVKGTNREGEWSRRRASIRVTVSPPVWGTWWFRGLAAAAAAGLALHTYRQRVRGLRLESESDDAHEAQRSIRPRQDPRLPGFEVAAKSLPASEVSGDFFDFVWGDAEHSALCIAIGDVAGKGIRASMTAVTASGMVVSMIEAGRSLEEVLESVNEVLIQKDSPRQFTALCLARLEASTRELRYVNAGLAEPLLKSWQGVRFLAGPERRLPLGVQEKVTNREERLQLDPGDVFVLYSYGIPEATGPAGEVYGKEALEHRLDSLSTDRMAAREILDSLLAKVRRFAAGSPRKDDMTMIVVKAELEVL